MIRFQKLTATEAKRIITEYDNYDDVAFQDLVYHWTHYDPVSDFHPTYDDFRKELIQTFQAALAETGGKMNYLLDLRMGLKIYELLPPGNEFSVIQSNDNDIWRYISVKVMPDITYLRYPDPETAVKEAGPNACPPMIVGVGIGGTFEKCALMAKEALTREVGSHAEIEWAKELEEEVLNEINKSGIGPGGLGGTTTALAVNINTYPTHIAGLPVAVNICCHVNRHIIREV